MKTKFKTGDICNYNVWGAAAFKVKIQKPHDNKDYFCILLSYGTSIVIYEHNLTLADDLTLLEKALYE